MKRRNERQKGFTLIELLVVLIVIAVLAAVLVPALTRYLDDAREKKAVSEAQVCVTAATEWAAVQRTALISQAYQTNKSFADAYNAAGNTAKWSNDYAALNTAAPTVTGTPALAEGDGQYFLRPDSTPDDTTTDKMKNTVKTAAGVDGKLQKLQLNADGKVLYLLYTSAEGIPVAYTAAGTAQDPATTVPVATLPPDTPPTPPTPSHSGDLVFCVRNEYTGDPVPGIKFHVEDLSGKKIFDSRTTDKNGMVYFDLDPATLTNHFMQFKLVPDDWPEGYQQVFDVQFNIDASDSNGDGSYDSYKMQSNPVNTNQNTYNYKFGAVGKLEDGAEDHLYTFYVRPVPTLELRVWDDDNKKLVENVNFTLSKDGKSIPITSGLTNTVLDVKLHEKDNLRPGSDYLYMPYMPNNSTNANLLVEFTNFPEGYQSIDNFYLKIMLENLNGHNAQLCTQFSNQWVGGNQAHTQIECKDLPDQNKSVVTIHVQGGKDVNFFVYDGLDNVHTTQLPNAKMELYDSKNTKIATFTTDENGKPKGAENFTKTLSEGDYTLHLESGKPDDKYTDPPDIHFTITRGGADGLLTLTGDTAYVDNDKSTVTMLVTKPNTKRIQLQVVDAITGKPWAGVNVKVTGKCLKATKDEERNYKIDSLAKNTHTLDLDLLDEGDITVTIVGSDNKNEIEKKYHDGSYINNFVGSKFVFNLQKNTDDTVTLTAKNFNGSISTDGSTVLVYAYPKVNFDFKCNSPVLPEYAVGKGTLKVVTNPDKKSVITADTEKIAGHDTITPWEMNSRNRNHSEGVPIGNYTLVNHEEHGWVLFEPDPKTTPWNFSVERDNSSGFPVVKDKDGNILTDKTIVAWYNLLKTS